ncbi:MAG: adenylate/guanylate cyclase domain-containing protein [Rhodocyclaceae bacterium]|nr:MAG: adenylate/guanylate cyclase domain-containing protein [Rhodocyclaceae bacterium]
MGFARRLGYNAVIIALVAALLATTAVEGLYRSGVATRIEYLYTDLWHRLAGPREAPRHTALVMLDDPTLYERPDEPLAFWTPHFAKAVATLRQVGVKVVAIDFIFSGSPERWIGKLGLIGREASRNYDQHFREQINKGGVLLAGFRVGAGDTANDFILPSPDYLLALPDLDMPGHVGLANLPSDADGVVRRFALVEASSEFARKEGMPRLAFGALAASMATGQDSQAEVWRFGGREIGAERSVPIAYAGPPGSFAALSFRKLLVPNALSDPDVRALAGKVVVIGAGYASMNDLHPTPYSTSIGGANILMPGPEIQANVIETLLAGHFHDEVPAAVRLVTFAVVLGALAYGCMWLSAWRSVVLVILAMQVAAIAGNLLFKQDVLFPVAHLQAGMMVVLIGLSLLRLRREERERERIGQMFGRYVSPQVVTALLASPELPELGGQTRQISVLFSDIRNFTTFSERLSAKEVVELLNTYLERACAVLLAEGASIDKFIGDAIMAEFGAPLAQIDHASRALRAAVALRAVAVEFRVWVKQRFAGRDLPEFDIGIGVHSGEAVVGNIGASVRMEYTAIGDTVNIASRLEGKTKETGAHILASRDTVSMFGGELKTGALYCLTVKGRAEPVEAFEIVALK